MKGFILIILISIVLPVYKTLAQFEQYFTQGALRYDFEVAGTSNSEMIFPKQIKALSNWGGNPGFLIDETNQGTFRYSVYCYNDNELIFKKGFSPLFQEWQHTPEALVRARAFYHAAFFPKPKSDVYIQFEKRCILNEWHFVFADTIRADNIQIVNELPHVYPVDTLLYNGNSAKHVDIFILSEGYRVEEMEQYVNDATRMIDYMFDAEPYKTHKNRFNVFAMQVPSLESGTDAPGEGIFRNTAFNTHFYTFYSPRYLTVTDLKSVYDALDAVAWDQFFILVNTDRYGGGGCYNSFNISSAGNPRSEFVFCHEFAHGFAGLADEYYYQSTDEFDNYYSLDVEPVEPNITTLVNFDGKWKRMLDEDTPVPTPRDDKYKDKVGVFEGGGYREKGIYSPAITCWMKEESAGGFCPVCQKAIEKMILRYSE